MESTPVSFSSSRFMNRRHFALSSLAMLATSSRTARILSASRHPPAPSLSVNGERLNTHIAELSQFGRNSFGGVSRVAYSDADISARAWARMIMQAARLDVSVDFAGNIVGRRPGSDAS